MKEIIYIDVKECILCFANGKQKIVSAQESGDFLIVYVMEYKPDQLNFVELVLKNYHNSKTVEDLSIRCNYISAKTFTRHFKKNFNISPKQWMLEMKENELRYYLKSTNFTLTKIASLLGFANVSHLWNFCIKKTGMPPNEIRKEQFDQPNEEDK